MDQWGRAQLCVEKAISNFQHSLEENRLSDVLYDDDGKPRNEVISQRIFFAVARIFGELLDVDVSREGNAGPGAADFRFSVGHKERILLEMKLSSHPRLRDGYYEQLPAYGKAEGIKKLILMIIKVISDDGSIGALELSIRHKKLPIEIVVIDAVKRSSASKRRASK